MDASHLLMAYLAITIAWPFIVMMGHVMARLMTRLIKSLPVERWLKLLDSIGDKTVFAGLALIFGALYSLLWGGSSVKLILQSLYGGVNLLIIGYIIIVIVSRGERKNA
jgi:hypothetical protein